MRYFLHLPLLLLTLQLVAQPASFTQIEDADEHLKHKNYLMAIPLYKKELQKDPDNIKAVYRLGICYVNSRVNRELAVPLLERASVHPKIDPEVWWHLGRAYQLTNRIDEAIDCFQKYASLDLKHAVDAEKKIQECKNALMFMRSNSSVTFKNLGPTVNSSEPDYNPFVNQEETFLVFTSRRKENIGGKNLEMDGYRNSDVWICEAGEGRWNPASNAGRGINSPLDEQVTGMNPDGNELYLYVDRIEKVGDLYVSIRQRNGQAFPKAQPFENRINQQFESSGCISMEGDVLFISRKSLIGNNTDLYISRKLPNGHWGEPLRLPDIINTPYNEDMPYLSYDGRTLYFASQGHNSMGGFDLFRTVWDPYLNTFTPPENLGFPINSTDDDLSISVTADGHYAYVSSFRPNGLGDLDLYRVRLSATDPIAVVYNGQLYYNDTINKAPSFYTGSILVKDLKTQYEYTYIPHSKTGKFILPLPAGRYRITVYAKGCEKLEEDILVEDVGKRKIEMPLKLVVKTITKSGS